MDFQIEQIYSKSNLPILKINNYFLHSKYDPCREAKQFASNKYEVNCTHIILGYGSGYIIEALLNEFKFNEKLIVIDPFVEKKLIKIQPKHKKQNNILFFNSKQIEHLAYFLRKTEMQDFQMAFSVFVSPNYDKFFNELHLVILKQVKEIQYRSIVDINTELKYADSWQANTINSLFNLQTDVSLNVLQDKFNLPIVIVSGGPSLTKQLPSLKNIEKNIIIIAAGSSVNSLLAYNIEPDYVVSIDGSKGAYMHYENKLFERTRLIYTFTNYAEVRNSFRHEAYLFAIKKDVQLITSLKDKFDLDFPIIQGGGTVAHFSLHIARYISSGPIALIGQDLAYTNNQTHAESNERFKNVKLEELEENTHFYTNGYDDEPVLTSSSFYDMKRDFERLIMMIENPGLIFNCTEGGVKLDGFNQIPFKLFIERYIQFNKGNKFNLLNDNSQSNLSHHLIIEYFNETLEIYSQLKKQLQLGLRILKKNNSLEPYQVNELKSINLKIDRLVKTVPINETLNKIKLRASRIYLANQNEIDSEKNERVLKGTHYIFKQLLESIDAIESYTKELLSKSGI